MVPVDHPEWTATSSRSTATTASRSEDAEEWLAGELAKRSQRTGGRCWNGTVPAAQRAMARPSREACAEACNLAAVAGLVDSFRKWRTGEQVPGLVEAAESGLKVNLSRGCGDASRILEQISLAYVGLGKAPPEIIPLYRSVSYAGNFPFVDPAEDWYDMPVAAMMGTHCCSAERGSTCDGRAALGRCCSPSAGERDGASIRSAPPNELRPCVASGWDPGRLPDRAPS